MTVQELIDTLQKVSDKSRKVVCRESDYRAKDPKDAGTIREVAFFNSEATPYVRIYFFQ